MATRRSLPLLLILCTVGCAGELKGRRLPEAAITGRAERYFNGYTHPGVQCWRCHDGSGTGTSEGPSLFVRVPRVSRLTMLATVTRGRGRTPKLQADVSEADANELVTWLKLKFGPVE